MPPRITSEDPRTSAAVPEKVYDEMQVSCLRFLFGHLTLTLDRVSADGEIDPIDGELNLKFKSFDDELVRCSNLETTWNNMLRGIAALYRERRLVEKIAALRVLEEDTAELEARLASVRSLLGAT